MLEIRYLDNHLVAVNKPTGLLVHRSPIDRHETRFALQLVRDQLGMRVFPVHRLDKPTSGVLIFALSPETANRLMCAFADGRVAKRYLAVVRGVMADAGVIDYPLVEEPDQMEQLPAGVVRPPQEAVTRFRRLAQVELPLAVGRYATSRYSLVELEPRTGRRRQLRRHLKHLFHPIIGDTTYGDSRHNRLFREQFDSHRLLLHAAAVTFDHPATGEPLRIKAPLPAEFSRVLQELGWDEYGI